MKSLKILKRVNGRRTDNTMKKRKKDKQWHWKLKNEQNELHQIPGGESRCSRMSGVLKKSFILSKHGTKANIRSTKMANNRHAFNRNILQSYWTSDGLPLYCSQPTGEKKHTNQQCERLAKIRQTTGNIWSWRHGIAAFGYTDAIDNLVVCLFVWYLKNVWVNAMTN